MQAADNVYNLSNEYPVSREYLLDNNSFVKLISPDEEIDDTFFNNLISEWQKNEQTAKYVNLDSPDSPKIKIDKLIADGKLAQNTIKNFNNQILSENAEQIFDFGNGITVDANLILALSLHSVKNLDGFAEACKSNNKLSLDKSDNVSIAAVCTCKTAKDSVKNINEILQFYPEFTCGLSLLPVNCYSKNSIKDVKHFKDSMSSLMGDQIVILIRYNIDAFDANAFKNFIDKGFEFQVVENDDGQMEKQFFFTDINSALETGFFELDNLTLKAQNFDKNSVQDVKIFCFEENEGVIYSKICHDLIQYNPEAFATGAFKDINLSGGNACRFLGLNQGTDKQSVIIYKILGYILYVFLVGFLFDWSKKFLEQARNNEEYNQYIDQLKKIIERDNTNDPQESQKTETETRAINQKILQIDDRDAITPLTNNCNQKNIII